MSLDYQYQDIAKMIDHSLLNPALSVDELESGCRLAIEYDVASVCILPYFAGRCAQLLEGTTVLASTTVGFPHGGQRTDVKQFEAERAIADGCRELDMVVNISLVRSGRWGDVQADMQAVIDVVHAAGQKVKVIFENCCLTDDQKRRLCELCGDLRADWAKTSTGYGSGGATDEDLMLMRRHCPPHVQIKAAGGVRDFQRVLAVRKLGATRIGASRTQEILDECRRVIAQTKTSSPQA